MPPPQVTINTVLFDLDGTLLDTAPEFAVVLNQLLSDAGLAPLPEARIRERVSDGARALVQLGFGEDEPVAAFDARHRALLHAYQQGLGAHTQPFDGIAELLNHLPHHNLAWGIVTNKPAALCEPLLLAMEMTPDTLVCADQVEAPKPHPAGLLRACRTLGCTTAQALYVGDHRRDIEAAHNAGMGAAAATWGYIHSDDPPEHWGADYLLHSPAELIRLLTIP